MSWSRAVHRWWRRAHARSGAQEGGFIAVVTAIVVAAVALPCAAIAVDVGSWYVQVERVQKAADAASLAGVPYLPQDLASATTTAKATAARNGFDDADANTTVDVRLGDKSTQLMVTITYVSTNTFGSAFGAPTATITRSSTSDYQGPAPMGSPCNTFGNEPGAGDRGLVLPTGTAQGSSPPANCSRTPQFWGLVEGPGTDKVQGDRYQTSNCATGTAVDNCTTGKVNSEYDPFGYIFVVKVAQAAVNSLVKLQLYDPMYVNAGTTCGSLPSSSSFGSSGNANTYVTNADAKNRYTSNGSTSSTFCSGDNNPESGRADLTTSFVLRQQTDTQNPKIAAVQTDTNGSPCIQQYGTYNAGGGSLSASAFDGTVPDLAATFHNWTNFCSFTPTRAGDYYLQVRTNVALAGTGTTYVKSGNVAAAALTGNTTSGNGANAFSVRAVTTSGNERNVAVSGFNHMPIFINAPSAVATFNLIRVLPGAAGQKISFSYFDAGDAQGSGSVQVLRPTDATGAIAAAQNATNCTAYGGTAGGSQASQKTYADCSAPISKGSGSTSLNNGKVETVTIPIPTDYDCTSTSFDGCWYRVKVTFSSGSVTDVTTWNATVLGDPVRLVK